MMQSAVTFFFAWFAWMVTLTLLVGCSSGGGPVASTRICTDQSTAAPIASTCE